VKQRRTIATTLARLVSGLLLGLLILLLGPDLATATDLKVSDVVLEPCPAGDSATQPQLARASGASCWALRGVVVNPGSKPAMDTDVFGLILDASGEPVLPNRTRVGSIGDVPPGRSSFALRLAVPAGTPGPQKPPMPAKSACGSTRFSCRNQCS